MGRKPETDPTVRDTIERLAARDVPSAEIRRRLLQTEGLPVDLVPSQRTVDRIARPHRAGLPTTADDAWQSGDADPEDAGIVLGALAAAITESQGRITGFTRELADWVVRVQRGVPDMPPSVVWKFASEYTATPAGQREHLDMALGWARALEDEPVNRPLIAAHVKAHVDRWIRWPLVVWARSEDAARAYIEEVGNHASLSRPGEHSYFDNDYFGRLIIETGKETE